MFIEKIKNLINDLNTASLFFVFLCLFYLNPVITGNEENYLSWAKAYFDPEWMPNSFIFDHWLGHRFFFEIFFGFLLSHLSFEAVMLIGRIILCWALAFTLSKLFKQIKLTNLESLLIVVVFIFCGQNYFGGEWIFVGVEPKVFAYPFIFLSITELLKENRATATLYLVASTYMHVLAAGWFVLYFFVYLVCKKIKPKDLGKLLALYIAGVLPLVMYLAPKVFSGPSDVNGIHLNWIYVYFRVPHHAAPFIDGYLNWDVERIIALFLCFVLAILIHKKKTCSEEIKFFNNFNIIIPTFLIFFIIVGYFDNSGDILKFRPFRGNSIYLLFVFIETVLLIRMIQANKKFLNLLNYLSIGILGYLVVYGIGNNINQNFIKTYLHPSAKKIAWNEVTAFSKDHTVRDSIFIIKGINEKISRAFSRMSDRDIFVLKKFVPIDKNKWYEWYQRVQTRVDNVDQMTALKKKYKLDYFLTVSSGPRIGKVVFENSHYIISRLDN